MLAGLEMEAQHNANDSGDDEGDAQDQRQHGGGQQRVFHREEAAEDVERADQDPEQRAAEPLHAEAVDDLDHAADDHHGADPEDRDDGGFDDAEKRDGAGDDEHHAEADEPPPAQFQMPQRFTEILGGLHHAHRLLLAGYPPGGIS